MRDSQCMLVNLTDEYFFKARDNDWGGVWCNSGHGPSFGYKELLTNEPLLGKDKVLSFINNSGFRIGGKEGDINPLTGDIIVRDNNDGPHSKSTALEIEVWHITTNIKCITQ